MYVLREDMYHEWSWENGACEIICLSNNAETIYNELHKRIKEHEGYGRILEQYRDNVGLLKQIKDIKGTPSGVYVDVYDSQDEYDDGKNMATLVVEYFKVKE